jgi:hypothetical protein
MILPNHDDYRRYTNEELEAFLRSFPRHADRELAVREQDVRQKIMDDVATQDRDRDNEKRHKENQTLGQKTLFWAKIGGIAAVIGTIVLLIFDTPISKLLPSTSSQAPPTSPTPSPASTPE